MPPTRRLCVLAALLTIGTAVSPRQCSTSGDEISPQVLDTFFRMRVVAAVLDTQRVQGPYPGPTEGLVPVSSLGDQLAGRIRLLRGSVRDAWKNPILYWSDGRAQFDYSADPAYANVPKGWGGTDPADDLLIVNGIAFRGPISQGEYLLHAMSDLRSAGTACESFAVDTNFYPGPVDPIDAITRVASDLEPIYILHLPKLDPWGHPYLFWSDTRAYAIVSYGQDGTPDYPYATWSRPDFEALHTGPTTRFGQDIVLVNYQFAQWPAIGNGP